MTDLRNELIDAPTAITEPEIAIPPRCASCGITYHDPEMVTDCERCGRPVCGGCADEDIVCPTCHNAWWADIDLGERPDDSEDAFRSTRRP